MPIKNHQKFVKEVESNLKRTGMSKSALSKKLGWSSGVVSSMLRERIKPSDLAALRILQAVGGDVSVVQPEVSAQVWETGYTLSAPGQGTLTSFMRATRSAYFLVNIDEDLIFEGAGPPQNIKASDRLKMLCVDINDAGTVEPPFALVKRTKSSGREVMLLEEATRLQKPYEIWQILTLVFA